MFLSGSEENVYFLCKKLCANGMAHPDGSDLYIIFISNDKKQACTSFSLKLSHCIVFLFLSIYLPLMVLCDLFILFLSKQVIVSLVQTVKERNNGDALEILSRII